VHEDFLNGKPATDLGTVPHSLQKQTHFTDFDAMPCDNFCVQMGYTGYTLWAFVNDSWKPPTWNNEAKCRCSDDLLCLIWGFFLTLKYERDRSPSHSMRSKVNARKLNPSWRSLVVECCGLWSCQSWYTVTVMQQSERNEAKHCNCNYLTPQQIWCVARSLNMIRYNVFCIARYL